MVVGWCLGDIYILMNGFVIIYLIYNINLSKYMEYKNYRWIYVIRIFILF